MMHKINARLSQRIAQESQLLAEEKWIINALRKVKQQRNSIQIERFHLENIRKNELYGVVVTGSAPTCGTTVTSESTVPQPPESTILQPPPSEVPQKTAPMAPTEENRVFTSLSHFDVPVAGIDNEMINNEQLDLSVTNSVFANQQFGGFDMEEEDEEFEEDDMEIEMNLLMNSKPCK